MYRVVRVLILVALLQWGTPFLNDPVASCAGRSSLDHVSYFIENYNEVLMKARIAQWALKYPDVALTFAFTASKYQYMSNVDMYSQNDLIQDARLIVETARKNPRAMKDLLEAVGPALRYAYENRLNEDERILLAGYLRKLEAKVSRDSKNVKEVIAEGVYSSNPGDSPAKIEELALSQARLAAVEKLLTETDSATVAKMKEYPAYAANLAAAVFDAEIMEKKQTPAENNKVDYSIAIKAFVDTNQLKEAIQQGVLPGQVSYSADYVTYNGGRVVDKGTVWCGNNFFSIKSDINQSVIITRLDTTITYLLQNNKYFELYSESKRKLIGTETLNGKIVNKYHIKTRNALGPDTEHMQWVDPVMGVVMKNEHSVFMFGTYRGEYANVRFGPQNPELFVIPKTYKKCSDIMELYSSKEKPTGPWWVSENPNNMKK